MINLVVASRNDVATSGLTQRNVQLSPNAPGTVNLNSFQDLPSKPPTTLISANHQLAKKRGAPSVILNLFQDLSPSAQRTRPQAHIPAKVPTFQPHTSKKTQHPKCNVYT
jgi:hypothetical protein